MDGIVHYCVANMPGAVARTSTFALTNTTLPYAVRIANHGWKAAIHGDESLRKGLNVADGKLICQAVGDALGIACVSIEGLIN